MGLRHFFRLIKNSDELVYGFFGWLRHSELLWVWWLVDVFAFEEVSKLVSVHTRQLLHAAHFDCLRSFNWEPAPTVVLLHQRNELLKLVRLAKVKQFGGLPLSVEEGHNPPLK